MISVFLAGNVQKRNQVAVVVVVVLLGVCYAWQSSIHITTPLSATRRAIQHHHSNLLQQQQQQQQQKSCLCNRHYLDPIFQLSFDTRSISSFQLYAKKSKDKKDKSVKKVERKKRDQKRDSNNNDNKEEKTGIFSRIFGSRNNNEKSVQKEEKSKRNKEKKQKDKVKNNDDSSDNNGGNIFKSVARRLTRSSDNDNNGKTDDQDGNKLSEKDRQLLEKILTEESGDSNSSANKFFKTLDTLSLTNSITKLDESLAQIRQEMTKPTSAEQERRLNELRKRAELERKQRLDEKSNRQALQQQKLQAQQLADQRAVERRKERMREIAEKEALNKERAIRRKAILQASKTTSSNADVSSTDKKPTTTTTNKKDENENKDDMAGNNDTIKKFINIENPLSIGQKLVSNVLDKIDFTNTKNNDDEEWIVVAPKTRIAPGEIVPVVAAGLDLLLIASKDGSALHCVANSCPHLGTPLETGILERRPQEKAMDMLKNREDTGDLVNIEEMFNERRLSEMLSDDGCEDCIVCPLHQTAFALKSGEVRGEWCPYPPVLGKMLGVAKPKTALAVFDVRTRGKNIEVRLNTPVQ